jgi:hypothetical protein
VQPFASHRQRAKDGQSESCTQVLLPVHAEPSQAAMHCWQVGLPTQYVDGAQSALVVHCGQSAHWPGTPPPHT